MNEVSAGDGKAAANAVRVEHDLLGTKEVPADAYYGIQTLRALENFHISGVPISHYPELIEGTGHDQDGCRAREPGVRAVQSRNR